MFRAIQQALKAFGKDFATLKPEDSLWPSSADSGRGITSGTFYGNLRRYFQAAGLRPQHVSQSRLPVKDAKRRLPWRLPMPSSRNLML